eukprot:CAMPEP_0181134818 /NCGR_PEP_ID=MMETSP1071-20121207/32292_1 /TAXON_ID=35127 /ORGANISM="Thalassiosira sp., Strain NH16" /LENGTH=301 /DNA_ID=CAMNT_0023221365 /DNA_START=38 /DNA_END=943 /DNA_ORIENTATION=+
MKLSLGTLLLSAGSGGGGAATMAFAPPSKYHNRRVRLAAASGGGGDVDAPAPTKKVLTAADVVAKSKSSAPGGPDDPAAPGMQDAPKIFSEAIYDDFQSALLLLEKRVRDGAGSIGPDEVSKFEEETDRIVAEMREYMADPKGCGERIRKGYESKVEIDVTATEQKEEAPKLSEPLATKTAIKPEPTIAAESPPPAAAAIPPPATTGDDDGPSEDSVTFGMARGTANTFIIPGMDEMSGEEYRAKLQETVSAHQAHRRRQSLAANKGKIGNANSQSYLESLGSGGGNTGLGAPGGGKKKQG